MEKVHQHAPTLREARIRAGWTQSQLAKVTDLTNVTISNIENGKTKPAVKTIRQIEVICGRVDWQRTRDQAIILSNGHHKQIISED